MENTPKVILPDLKRQRSMVLRRIKSDAGTDKIPIVVLTPLKEDQDVEKC